ncbi:response regulator transcription factor [Coralliovum pocilloporae]|uniref:response regulator transcription factor n=1 Tax=Coralliovum pocilloporae TaxID=3066369 RepID=UPI0033073316
MLRTLDTGTKRDSNIAISRNRDLGRELDSVREISGMDTAWIGFLTTLKGANGAMLESGKIAQSGFSGPLFKQYLSTFDGASGLSYGNDPICRAMFSQTLPLFWALDEKQPALLFEETSRTEQEQALKRVQLGQNWGVTIPVHLPTHAMLLVTLSSSTVNQDRVFLQGALSVRQGELLMQAHKLAQICTEKLTWDRVTTSNGKRILSPRERDCLSLARRGLTAAGIAEEINLQPETCRSYLKSAYRKLDVQNRTEAVIRAMELGEI